jgi:hypothetical protein
MSRWERKLFFDELSVKDRGSSKKLSKYHGKSADVAALLLRSPKK